MRSRSEPVVDASAAAVRSALRLTRGITATWWYTVSAVVFFEFMLVLTTAATMLDIGVGFTGIWVVGLGGLVWWVSTFVLLQEYRGRSDATPLARWPRVAAPLLVAVAYGIASGVVSGIWVVGLLPVIQSVMLLNWPSGLRLRVVIAATVLLAALWFIDARVRLESGSGLAEEASLWFLSFYCTLLPAMSILSLWWWDVLIALDRARLSEAKLAATQERLRVATDVHDLQGHHLQVIALQLELAERLLERDPSAALEQLRAARGSVDEARQGTRDLAMRFRSAPLRDEMANAADLLRAAGTPTEVSVDPDADRAPSGVLGAVIRETTTNALRHGGGSWARLSLTRHASSSARASSGGSPGASSWRYEIANDVAAGTEPPTHDGSGLEGLQRRATEAGGTLEVHHGEHEFVVIVTVPDRIESAADETAMTSSAASFADSRADGSAR